MAMTESKAPSHIWQSNEITSAESVGLTEDFVAYLRRYAHEKPESAAMICLGIGFILGWKLKFW
ncbi:MAG: hypothetical protein ACYC0X_16700 [Pirellulaceae bacterium]